MTIATDDARCLAHGDLSHLSEKDARTVAIACDEFHRALAAARRCRRHSDPHHAGAALRSAEQSLSNMRALITGEKDTTPLPDIDPWER